jgi:hypothetical protein
MSQVQERPSTGATASARRATDPASAFEIARDYLIRFYPLWFTFLDLADEPMVVTIPETSVTYSMLVVDPYGTVLQTNIAPQRPGAHAFTGPGYSGRLPTSVSATPVPIDFPIVIFRADKHSSTGEAQLREAEAFRTALKAQGLAAYVKNPSGGSAIILPESQYAIPFKTAADHTIANDPMTFLKQLQAAVGGAPTPPLTPEEQALVKSFNVLLAYGDANGELAAGAQAAHEMIIDNYISHRDANNWISFTNIGNWGTNYLDRASIAEFIQFGNGFSTAAYFQAFVDKGGQELNGASKAYVLRFPKDEIPQAKRFWSVTAYTPEAIELIPNAEDKYLVGSYTKDLQHDPDGSISIYIAHEQPAGAPKANWLPVSARQFNIMLRAYGPEGKVASGGYVPPAIEAR